MAASELWAPLAVRKCDVGRGIFAVRRFESGERILILRGGVISQEATISKGSAHEGDALQVGPFTYLDLDPPGVFINHSCKPNAGIRGKKTLYALRRIEVGEEVRFDYSTSIAEGRWTMQCRCGEACCRSVIGDFKDLPESLQAAYVARGIVQPFIVDVRNANRARRMQENTHHSVVDTGKSTCRSTPALATE